MTDEPKDTESMIERVARVIELALERYGVTDYEGTIEDAVVAITAMREPTEAMRDAARDWSEKKFGKPIGSDASDGCFNVQIDAALAGGRP